MGGAGELLAHASVLSLKHFRLSAADEAREESANVSPS